MSKSLYYLTPSDFFGESPEPIELLCSLAFSLSVVKCLFLKWTITGADDGASVDRADTAKNSAGILDAKNVVR